MTPRRPAPLAAGPTPITLSAADVADLDAALAAIPHVLGTVTAVQNRLAARRLARRAKVIDARRKRALARASEAEPEPAPVVPVVLCGDLAGVWHATAKGGAVTFDGAPISRVRGLRLRSASVADGLVLEARYGVPQKASVANILAGCAHVFGVDRHDMVSACRQHRLMVPRIVASYLARRLTTCSLPEIGRRLGGRDHTSIMHRIAVFERDYRPFLVEPDEAAGLDVWIAACAEAVRAAKAAKGGAA